MKFRHLVLECENEYCGMLSIHPLLGEQGWYECPYCETQTEGFILAGYGA